MTSTLYAAVDNECHQRASAHSITDQDLSNAFQIPIQRTLAMAKQNCLGVFSSTLRLCAAQVRISPFTLDIEDKEPAPR